MTMVSRCIYLLVGFSVDLGPIKFEYVKRESYIDTSYVIGLFYKRLSCMSGFGGRGAGKQGAVFIVPTVSCR